MKVASLLRGAGYHEAGRVWSLPADPMWTKARKSGREQL
jgi:hypothetical protein